MRTIISVKTGDLLEEVADVIVSTGNPWLRMSGGVNGAILLQGGESIQDELQAYLRAAGKAAVDPGSVVVTGSGCLKTRKILHAVAIDPFYNTSIELVRATLERALTTSRDLGAKSVAMPTLATGYGRLPVEDFAVALSQAMSADWSPIEHITVVVHKPENADVVRGIINRRDDSGMGETIKGEP